MSRLKEFIHEMHRRSLWQVLGIYVVGAWVGYEVIQSLTEGMGLPTWFPSLAVVLFIIGLPVVLATAFVQEGVGHHQPGSTSGEVETTSGGTPIPPAKSVGQPQADLGARSLLTWRNAIIGGVIAFALWGAIGTTWLLFADRATSASAPTGGTGEPQIGSIAVLAFDDMSAEGDQEYFSDGISEEILDALAQVDGLRVAARSSSFSFKGTNSDVREVGDKLGVEAVLEGSVRKSGDQLRITAQLVNTEDGFHMWSQTYDRRLADVFTVQEEIARAIVAALGFAEAGDLIAASRATEERIAAYDFYLLGLHRWHTRSSEEDLEEALSYFERAAAEDSLFARVHAARALVYAALPQFGDFPADEAIRLGKLEAARAIELDPSLPEPHAALCQIANWYELAWTEGVERCERALALAPNYSTAHQWTSEILIRLGRSEEALAEATLGKALDPLAPIMSNAIAWSYIQLGDYEAALAAADETMELAPESWFAAWGQVMARFGLGRAEGLEQAFLKWAVTPEDSTIHTAFVGLFLEAATNEKARLEAVAMVPELSLHVRIDPVLYMHLNAPERALNALEEMYEDRSGQLPHTLQMALMTPIRSDPRFIELKRKTGLDRPPAATD